MLILRLIVYRVFQDTPYMYLILREPVQTPNLQGHPEHQQDRLNDRLVCVRFEWRL